MKPIKPADADKNEAQHASTSKFNEKVRYVCIDAAKMTLISAAGSSALGGLIFLVGFLQGGAANGLEAAKNGLLLTGAAGLFLLAGSIMAKGKGSEQFTQKESWRKHFKIIGYKTALGILCAVLICVSAGVDMLMRLLS
ncbi:hypothetical protein FACS18948_0470 [Clostridia bacterium]|nr:hypothetical protein FACS18948_0470 [Clostridia bacterium]